MIRTVAYQGAPGAFGEEACKMFLPELQTVARSTFAAVVDAVLEGKAELGMLPVENSIAGPVPGLLGLLDRPDLGLIGHHSLPVRLHLMANDGVRLEQIRIVSSHPMALAQCSESLQSLGLVPEEASNTAAAAQALAEAPDPARAVIASEAASLTYGLHILRRDVHDRPDNFTTFCVIARNAESKKAIA